MNQDPNTGTPGEEQQQQQIPSAGTPGEETTNTIGTDTATKTDDNDDDNDDPQQT